MDIPTAITINLCTVVICAAAVIIVALRSKS